VRHWVHTLVPSLKKKKEKEEEEEECVKTF
jgi:hypothetical protein